LDIDVTLIAGLGVVQGHWKSRRSIDHIDVILVCCCNYAPFSLHFTSLHIISIAGRAHEQWRYNKVCKKGFKITTKYNISTVAGANV